jgi:hypothetical protein
VAPHHRIVKTTNIDVFLNCDDMTAEELKLIEDQERKESKEFLDDEEEDPEWASENVVCVSDHGTPHKS